MTLSATFSQEIISSATTSTTMIPENTSYVTRIMGLSAKKNTTYQMKLSGVIDLFTHEV